MRAVRTNGTRGKCMRCQNTDTTRSGTHVIICRQALHLHWRKPTKRKYTCFFDCGKGSIQYGGGRRETGRKYGRWVESWFRVFDQALKRRDPTVQIHSIRAIRVSEFFFSEHCYRQYEKDQCKTAGIDDGVGAFQCFVLYHIDSRGREVR